MSAKLESDGNGGYLWKAKQHEFQGYMKRAIEDLDEKVETLSEKMDKVTSTIEKNKSDIGNIKTAAGLIGAGAGVVITVVLTFLQSLFK